MCFPDFHSDVTKLHIVVVMVRAGLAGWSCVQGRRLRLAAANVDGLEQCHGEEAAFLFECICTNNCRLSNHSSSDATVVDNHESNGRPKGRGTATVHR